MKIPPIQGKFNQSGFFIYAAADSKYFDKYAVPLINSAMKNTTHGVHLHLFNPRSDQIDFCNRNPRVSATWEYINEVDMHSAIEFWKPDNLPEPYQQRKIKMLGLKQYQQTGNDLDQLISWLWKTYYACMRFVRLAAVMARPQKFLAIDVDGLVRKSFLTDIQDINERDLYLYEKEKGGFLAGAMLFTDTLGSLRFIHHLSRTICNNIEKDNIYWFLDQHSIESLIYDYNYGILPKSYVDWGMSDDSAIWSAKGKRKHLEVFQKELMKYK